jgi:hypothetical protein
MKIICKRVLIPKAFLTIAVVGGCSSIGNAPTPGETEAMVVTEPPSRTPQTADMKMTAPKALPPQADVPRSEPQSLRDSQAGKLLDQQDYILALNAERQALSEGKAEWRNSDSGKSGFVLRSNGSRPENRNCLEYSHVVVSDTSRVEVKRMGCKVNGVWEIR